MLPDKNELNDESIEQISGGSTNNILIIIKEMQDRIDRQEQEIKELKEIIKNIIV